MSRFAIFFVAAAAIAGIAIAATSSGAVTGPAQIRVTDTETQYYRVDIGRRGTSPGDMEIETKLIYNRRITTKPIGRAEVVCTFTVGNSRVCRGTFTLPRGKLIVGGSVQFRQLYELAVLGGTGLYDNARGTLTATQMTRKPRREILIFRLVG